jgi:hypothetical protein
VSKNKFASIFPYFGAKSKLVDLYSEPAYDLIIEPFAGGGSYSLRWYERNVWLNDLNPPTYAVWCFLTSPDALALVREYIPKDVTPGTRIEDLLPAAAAQNEGLVWLMRSQFAQSAFGMGGVRSKVSPFGALAWCSKDNGAGGFRARLEYWIPRITHWRITNMSYADIPNVSRRVGSSTRRTTTLRVRRMRRARRVSTTRI